MSLWIAEDYESLPPGLYVGKLLDIESRESANGEYRRWGWEVVEGPYAGRKAQHLLIDTLAADNPLTEYALSARLDLMRAEIAGEDPTPLEALLVERIVAAWILNELLEVLNCAQLWRANSETRYSPHSFLRLYLNWQLQAHQRLLSSIKALAQVRKLQSNMPRVQYNTQINLPSTDGGQRGEEANH